MHFYSASKNSFLHQSLRGADGIRWPSDAVPVSAEEYDTYADKPPPQGMRLGAKASGQPGWLAADGSDGLSLKRQVEVMQGWTAKYLDDGARAKGFTDIIEAVSYAGDPLPAYAEEGNAFKAWRSSVRTLATATITAVGDGTLSIPLKSAFFVGLPKAPQ